MAWCPRCGRAHFSTHYHHCPRPANADMIEGFQDGYDKDAPEPSANRSASYRHGFMVGRLDNDKSLERRPSAAELERKADEAMEADEPRGC